MFKLAARPPLDETYLSNCIKWGYDCTGRTPYLGIQQLPPGAILHLEKNCAGMEIYWDWAKVPAPDLSLREIVEKAITNRLISDRPVAMLLSGGLDSSIIYYTLKNLGRQVEAFSVENGESEFLPEGIRTLPLAGVSLDEAVWTMQAPVDLGSLVPQVQLARAVAVAGYNVCLTGDGADELFGGYRRAKEYDSQKSDIFCELPYYHLPRLDRVMMRQTIELRSPFLAPSVVAYALRLPREYRTSKEALKYAFKGVVPDSIIERKKHPLKTPAVIAGGTAYRDTLVHTFRKHIREGAIA
jgi:asparagine synthetase B (glutamine-hydrolysing)